MSGSHSIDQATTGQSSSPAEGQGFAPPVADAPPSGGQTPPPAAEPISEPSAGPKKPFQLPTGGVEALERPEAQVGLAFAGGFLVALILKRLVG